MHGIDADDHGLVVVIGGGFLACFVPGECQFLGGREMELKCRIVIQRNGRMKRLFFIGLPIGLEFMFMSLVMIVMYWVIRDFGANAQAGLAEGQGALRFIMLPAMAVAFAAAPIAGQNFGARKPERVRETFNWTVGMSIGMARSTNCRVALAPSTRADSYNSRGTA